MKKFKFKFEALKNIRDHKKKLQQQKLARAEQKRLRLEQQIEMVKNDVARFNASRNNQTKTLGALHHRSHYSYLHENYQQLDVLHKQLHNATNEVAKERKKLIELSKDAKILENLKKKRRSSFLEEMDRLEQKQLNEIAIQQYNWIRG